MLVPDFPIVVPSSQPAQQNCFWLDGLTEQTKIGTEETTGSRMLVHSRPDRWPPNSFWARPKIKIKCSKIEIVLSQFFKNYAVMFYGLWNATKSFQDGRNAGK